MSTEHTRREVNRPEEQVPEVLPGTPATAENIHGTPPIKDVEALDAINRYGSEGYFRLKNMGDKIFLGKIEPGAAYAIRLQTHYEQRNVREVMKPYTGGPVDDQGRPPGPWEVPVTRPPAFEERIDVVPIPHTERVSLCGQCAGQRRVSCATCAGSGMMACPMCMGSGMRMVPVMSQGRDAQGNVVMMPQMVSQPCTCARGRVRCMTCSGTGITTCPTCQGAGRVKTQDQVVVRFQTAAQGEFLDTTPVPDRWLAKFKGDLLVDQKARLVDNVRPVRPEVDKKVQALLEESRRVDENRSRIILQMLQVERIPLYEVDYMYAGQERKLWICGKEKGVHAPNAPWNRERYWGLISGGVLAALAAVGLFIYWFYFR